MSFKTTAAILITLLFIFSSGAEDKKKKDLYPDYDKPEPKKEEKKKKSDSDITDTKKGLDTGKGDITDTKKKLDIRKGDITDVHKKLEIRTGDLTNTRGMLSKTAYPNKEQMLALKYELARKLDGVNNYKIAHRKSPKLVSSRLQYSWKIRQENYDLEQRQKSLKVKDISDNRKKFLKGKIADIESNKKQIKSKIDSIDKQLLKLVASEKISGTGEYFVNIVTADYVDLMDKFGEPKHRFKKGAKLNTKLSKLDPNNYYEVKHKGVTYYAMRKYFKHP